MDLYVSDRPLNMYYKEVNLLFVCIIERFNLIVHLW